MYQYCMYKTGENDCTTDDGLWEQLRGGAAGAVLLLAQMR